MCIKSIAELFLFISSSAENFYFYFFIKESNTNASPKMIGSDYNENDRLLSNKIFMLHLLCEDQNIRIRIEQI